jgi:hypothetical protein
MKASKAPLRASGAAIFSAGQKRTKYDICNDQEHIARRVQVGAEMDL